MVFSGIPFLFYFLPAFLFLYFLVGAKYRNFVLLIFSLIFYAWGEPVYISLLVFSSLVDYFNGRMLEKNEGKRGRQKIFLIISIVVNVGLLAVFKYSSLFITSFNSVFGTKFHDPGLALPLGISFFTFQTMSYSIDVYRGEVKAEHNFLDYMCYVSMFPQLIAGPIVRYADVQRELKHRYDPVPIREGVLTGKADALASGMQRFLYGLFKKVLLANQFSALWDRVAETPDRSFCFAWLGLGAYALRIYFDFSGYSDMAIGLGKILGFNYPENFNYPYSCTSITDFWRRWHMTLSGWFKSYVYIPLGGNRKGKGRQLLNIFIVWGLTGFWHGASWNYLLWGLYFGILLSFEKLLNISGTAYKKGKHNSKQPLTEEPDGKSKSSISEESEENNKLSFVENVKESIKPSPTGLSQPEGLRCPSGEDEGGRRSRSDEGQTDAGLRASHTPLHLLSRLITLILILIGWMIFAIEDMHELPRYAAQIFGFGAEGLAGNTFLYWFGNYGFVLIIGFILSQPVFPRIRKLAEEKTALANLLQIMAAALTMLLTLVCAAALISDGYNPFLYFRF